MSRIYTHMRGLFWEYKQSITEFKNKYYKDQDWICKEFWCVFIRFEPKMFGYWNMYYDGHTARSVVIFFIEIGAAYNYDSRPAVDWDEPTPPESKP